MVRFVLCNCFGNVNRLARVKRQLAIVDASTYLASDRCQLHVHHECTLIQIIWGAQPASLLVSAARRNAYHPIIATDEHGFPQMFRKDARKSADFRGNAPRSTLNRLSRRSQTKADEFSTSERFGPSPVESSGRGTERDRWTKPGDEFSIIGSVHFRLDRSGKVRRRLQS